MIKPEVRALLHEALLGNEPATLLNCALIETLHCWDDLIDRDNPVDDTQVHRAFRLALVVIPGNSFYQQHFAELHPLLDNIILNWMTANELERRPSADTDLDLPVAFVIRSDYCNFLLKCLTLVGGFDHAAKTWPAVRRFWHGEGFAEYLRSLEVERLARGGAHVL